jgi:DNA-binding NarL/FixJ family response regulator
MKDGWRHSNKPLTDKQKALLPFLAQEMCTNDIAAALKIRASSVCQQVERMMDSLRLIDKDELIQYAKEHSKHEETQL